MDKTVTKSPVNNNNPNRSPSPEPSPPPSDLRHVSPSHPSNSKNNTVLANDNNTSKPRLDAPSPDSSPSSDLCHVSPSPPSQNLGLKTTRNAVLSADSSPSSDLCHVSPSTPNTKNALSNSKPDPNPHSEGSSPSSDLCHVSPSPLPQEIGKKATKYAVFMPKQHFGPRSEGSSSLSDLCHVSPSPRPSGRGVRREKAVLRAARREKEVRKAALGVRACGAAFCLVSLAVMAADKERGWALDSFYRYIEFRYCISVNVLGFLYSIAQTCDLVFTICTGKYVFRHQYRLYFDFALDQILTYLLMSASSSAATRVDDWESNWGKDQFPMMASISVGLSFMSFVALAASTLISGYALCTWSST